MSDVVISINNLSKTFQTGIAAGEKGDGFPVGGGLQIGVIKELGQGFFCQILKIHTIFSFGPVRPFFSLESV